MKFKVFFKTSDALEYAIEDALKYEERNDSLEDVKEDMRVFAEQYIRYGEEIVVEFDTDNNTVTVLKVKK